MEKEEPSYLKYDEKLYKKVVMYVGGSREPYKKGRTICQGRLTKTEDKLKTMTSKTKLKQSKETKIYTSDYLRKTEQKKQTKMEVRAKKKKTKNIW